MKNKKGLIILSSVVGICALGLIVSPLMDWSVDDGSISGNIGKSSRFSRKTTTESISNMEELIVNDPTYKNGIVAAYMVMQTRAQEFSALVDMSNEVAGDIPEFEGVIDEMNKVYVTVNNVCASLVRAGENINATLNGEKRPELAQNTINASLAYTTLQKQNKLATRFIDVADKYLQTNEGTDRLKFVRDQWVDYQRMTAALNGDAESAEALQKKGTLLSAEKSVAALGSFGLAQQVIMMQGANIANTLDVDNSMVKALPKEVVAQAFTVVGNAVNTDDMVGSAQSANKLSDAFVSNLNSQITKNLCAAAANDQDFIQNVGWGMGVANQISTDDMVGNQVNTNDLVGNQINTNDLVSNQVNTNDLVGNQTVFNSFVMGNFTTMMSAFGVLQQSMVASAQQVNEMNNSVIFNSNMVGSFIQETSVGNVPSVSNAIKVE